VAARALVKLLRVDAGHAQPPGQLGHRRRRKRPQRHLLGGAAEERAHVVYQFRGNRPDDQQWLVREPVDQEVQRFGRRFTTLVQVVDHQEHRLFAGQPLEEPGDRLEGAAVLQLRRGPLVGAGGHHGPELRHQLDQRAGPRAGDRVEPVGRHGVDEPPQGVEDGLEEQRPFGLMAGGPEDGGAGCLGPGGEVGDEAGLARPGGAGDDHHGPPSAGGGRPSLVELRQLTVPADER
jgi:hypothetical protein